MVSRREKERGEGEIYRCRIKYRSWSTIRSTHPHRPSRQAGYTLLFYSTIRFLLPLSLALEWCNSRKYRIWCSSPSLSEMRRRESRWLWWTVWRTLSRVFTLMRSLLDWKCVRRVEEDVQANERDCWEDEAKEHMPLEAIVPSKHCLPSRVLLNVLRSMEAKWVVIGVHQTFHIHRQWKQCSPRVIAGYWSWKRTMGYRKFDALSGWMIWSRQVELHGYDASNDGRASRKGQKAEYQTDTAL